MSQWSQVSRIALYMVKVNVTEWVSEWVSQWQGHLLSCSGQLKKGSKAWNTQCFFINSVFLYLMFQTADLFFLLLCSEVSILREMWSSHKQALATSRVLPLQYRPIFHPYSCSSPQSISFAKLKIQCIPCFLFILFVCPFLLSLYIFSPAYLKPIWWIRFKADFESTRAICASSTNWPLSFSNCVNQDFQFNICFNHLKIF